MDGTGKVVSERDIYRSSLNDLRHFTESLTWKDMQEYLEEKLHQCSIILENPKTEVVDIRLTQGTMAGLRLALEFPEDLFSILEQEKDENERSRKTNQ